MARKTAYISTQCVACGACLKVCPLHAISIFRGSRASIDSSKCVGCGKCQKTCPASVIQLIERSEV